MKEIVVYVHGKGGSAQEVEHYKALFPDCEVVGFDYRAQAPWEATEEFPGFFAALRKRCEKLTLVAEAREALETLEKQLVQAQEEYDEATKTAKRSNYICNELFTWADVYDTANHDERRAILQQFIKEIHVRKDYEISITLNASFNQVEQLKAVSTYDGAEIFEDISEKGA